MHGISLASSFSVITLTCINKRLIFWQIEKGSSGFLPTHVTGVIAHGQDLKFCFVLIKWPADANTTVNVILSVLKFIKEKVWNIKNPLTK